MSEGVDVNTITLVGVGAIPLVLLLVQVAKIFGMPSTWAAPAAILLGLAVEGAVLAWAAWPEVQPYITFIVAGLQIGLAAAGTYSVMAHQAQVKGQDAAMKGSVTPAALPDTRTYAEEAQRAVEDATGSGRGDFLMVETEPPTTRLGEVQDGS